MLTLEDFTTMTEDEKANVVWSGNFLADRQAEGLTVQLYALPIFYVEVFYDPLANKITGFHAFTSKNFLVPYLAQIKFNQL